MAKIEELNKSSRRVIFANSGYPTKKGYKVELVHGVKQLVESGETINVFAKIQEHKDGCNLLNMIVRAENGDTTALNKHAGVFGDFVDMPGDKLELAKAVKNNERMFNELPSNIKEKFGNNFETFLLNYDKPEFYELFHNTVNNVNIANVNTANVDTDVNTKKEKGVKENVKVE